MQFSSKEAVVYRDVYNQKHLPLVLAGETGEMQYDLFTVTWRGLGPLSPSLSYTPHKDISKQALLYSTAPQLYYKEIPLKRRRIGNTLQYALPQGQVTIAFSPKRRLGFEEY
jgi:hypothetical protein